MRRTESPWWACAVESGTPIAAVLGAHVVRARLPWAAARACRWTVWRPQPSWRATDRRPWPSARSSWTRAWCRRARSANFPVGSCDCHERRHLVVVGDHRTAVGVADQSHRTRLGVDHLPGGAHVAIQRDRGVPYDGHGVAVGLESRVHALPAGAGHEAFVDQHDTPARCAFLQGSSSPNAAHGPNCRNVGDRVAPSNDVAPGTGVTAG